MKNIITAILVSFSVAFAPAAPALDLLTPTAMIVAFATGTQVGKPVPFHLTEACKAQTLKTEGSNISYTSYEHCLKK